MSRPSIPVNRRARRDAVRLAVRQRTLDALRDVILTSDSSIVNFRANQALNLVEIEAYRVALDFVRGTMVGLGPGPDYSLLLGVRGNLDYLIDTE